MMDEKWFKQQQRKAGVTSEDLAVRAGRTRTTISNIYAGRQRMTLDWAKVFSEMLNQPLDEILRRAGVTDEKTAQVLAPGFAESDAAPCVIGTGITQKQTAIAAAFGARPGVDIWEVRGNSMAGEGFLPGDFLLVDSNAADHAKVGDIVIAQVHDNPKGQASIALRRYEPPVLVAASQEMQYRRVLIVDGTNVILKGKVIASWRY